MPPWWRCLTSKPRGQIFSSVPFVATSLDVAQRKQLTGTLPLELAALIVAERQAQFGFGVHDERSGTGHRFVEWLAGYQ
jgi:hypothetical protein